MKKYIILTIIILFITIFIKIPDYNELNNIIIIDKIELTCTNNKKKISLREVKPIKQDNGITYKYNYYTGNISNLTNLEKQYKDKYHKNIYFSKTKYLVTNCNNIEKIKKDLKINPQKIKRIK